ncbi:DEAD/DEAH box helicase family protein [Marinifilum caeruleilacunae]|uniref:DEAD/DEAH box helicase n=1 Tax=Marinifilum caeruleilacunae TaxID=2499076 RepID=A0ABX1WWX2_9BACT|nr:DEAD/DEAH box helicase family protein [Marinifilum caeruleilacunae]NOU60579.1 DEAD/DEAH box helicase [Marinifilum caeruleilacunae]
MELRLYNYLRSVGLKNTDVDFRDSIYQDRLENFDKNLGLDNKLLDKIKKYLKTYNEYLKSNFKPEVSLRYYQILSLYYSELYFNKRNESDFIFSKDNLAYWMATGSGKTIVMHLNILQYLSFNKNFKDFEIIMTTPGVNLIEQHERELKPYLDFINKGYRNTIKLIIDTTQGLVSKAEKIPDYFEAPDTKTFRRLILVDEAHIGLGTNSDMGKFMNLRKKLNKRNSFLFEYSATFHNINTKLENEYEKAIVYDYNYNLFYRDGYGKDYFFQQIGDDILNKDIDDNLHHNLQVINEKIELWKSADYSIQKNLFKASHFPDKPLIAFMGNTVNNKDKSAKNEDDEVSDITNIVNFLAKLTETEKRKYKHLFNDETQGKLTLTRNPETDDEILLSYGIGGYWGIVNVGNGAKFINDLNNDNDIFIKNTRDQIIVSNIERYSFKNIDHKSSPINVLIGSRKFAEGWNCFRVSVIGLINLGSSKGNKIIQIFGRGVRIKGLKNDGKRTFAAHYEDYFSLDKIKEDEKLRMLETLCVFSLNRTYLEKFLDTVNKELSISKQFEVVVKPSIIKLNKGKELEFEKLKKHLPIFKLSKTEVHQKRVSLNGNNQFSIEYQQNGNIEKGDVNNFSIKLDYRTKKDEIGVDILGELSSFYRNYSVFIDQRKINAVISEFEFENGLFITTKSKKITFKDILPFVYEVKISEKKDKDKKSIDHANIDFIENVVNQVTLDFLKKLKNKVNWYINNNNYKYNEELKQSSETEKGDFIESYYIIKSIDTTKEVSGKTKFKSDAEIENEIQNFENTIEEITERLKIENIGNHIYHPLLRETNNVIEDEKELKITPDKLNSGEKKFIQDAAQFFSHNIDYKDFDIYLMRNVESLKSIGIYLNDDSQVFYPDFVLWLVSANITYINFIDPKGQMGLQDAQTLSMNEKVNIADKSKNETLVLLEKELKKTHNKDFILNSFLLLRDSSNMGTKGVSSNLEWQKSNMIDKHILRLNWHATDESEGFVDENLLPGGKSYLELMMEKTLNPVVQE